MRREHLPIPKPPPPRKTQDLLIFLQITLIHNTQFRTFNRPTQKIDESFAKFLDLDARIRFLRLQSLSDRFFMHPGNILHPRLPCPPPSAQTQSQALVLFAPSRSALR
jgi:hypothetical protein